MSDDLKLNQKKKKLKHTHTQSNIQRRSALFAFPLGPSFTDHVCCYIWLNRNADKINQSNNRQKKKPESGQCVNLPTRSRLFILNIFSSRNGSSFVVLFLLMRFFGRHSLTIDDHFTIKYIFV